MEARYFDIKKFPRYDVLSNKISRYFQNIEILPSTTSLSGQSALDLKVVVSYGWPVMKCVTSYSQRRLA